MQSTIRHLTVSGLVLGACLFSASALAAQGNSQKREKKAEQRIEKAEKKWEKTVEKRNDRIVARTTARRRAYSTRRVLCEDGVWVPRTTNACVNRGGLASRQGNYGTTPRASARARERASINSAVRRGPYANDLRSGAIARCSDGTYWHSTTRTGACYRHGGVATWL